MTTSLRGQLSLLPLLLRITKALMLLRPIDSMHPREPSVCEDLRLRLQSRSLQIEIVHSANAQEIHSRRARRDSIHDRPTDTDSLSAIETLKSDEIDVRAEERSHVAAGSGSVISGKARQLVLAADPFEVFVIDDEVGGEHCCRHFVAVGAVASESIDDAIEILEDISVMKSNSTEDVVRIQVGQHHRSRWQLLLCHWSTRQFQVGCMEPLWSFVVWVGSFVMFFDLS